MNIHVVYFNYFNCLGFSEDPETITRAEALHRMGVEVFAIGVGRYIYEPELTGIASPPKSSHKFVVTDYSSLGTITDAVTRGACRMSMF